MPNDNERAVAIIAAIFHASDAICRQVSQVESAVEKNYDGPDWTLDSDAENVARAQRLLDIASGLGPKPDTVEGKP